MAEALRPGGLYYIGDTAVDANGVEIKDAPKKDKDTDPSEQPGAVGGPSVDPMERLADILQGRTAAKKPAADKP
ncbi:MAG TPA: hypothetical protein VGQ44_17220 [Gemmatimonadaceae bacterium]|jgi:hypothetical protein|nr:hypothetical protein [Gemmatimonadaceae bacterium]